LLVLPGLIYYLVFCYVPMFGVVVAFQDYRITRGFLASNWVGFKHFINFFSSELSYRIIRNTLLLNIYSLLWGFPIPIVFAIALSEIKSNVFRKTVQTVSYLPYFISTVVTVGLVGMLLNVNSGAVNAIIVRLGGDRIDFLLDSRYFRSIFIGANIWKGFGWTSIIYMAAILGINPEYYEAAMIDGATKLQRIVRITLPGIAGTIIIMLLLNIGSLMSSSFDMVYLLQKPLNYDVSDVISTYVYRRGIAVTEGFPNFSFATAVGLFQSIVNVTLLVGANSLSKKFSETSLF
jgi:putative aldouronate transport system permease protein